MDSGFIDDDDMLFAAVSRFVEGDFDFRQRAACIANENGEAADIWQSLADLGALGVCAPEELGGINATPSQIVRVMEAFGRGLLTEPFVPTALVCASILRSSRSDDNAALLGAIAEGRARPTLAYLEPGRRFAADARATTLSNDSEGLTLTGRKSVVWGASRADAFVVSATTSDGASVLVFVQKAGEGVEVQAYQTYDGCEAGEVTFTAAPIAPEAVIASGADAESLLACALDLAALAVGAEALGVMEKAIEMTLDHLRTRTQFGKPLSANQALTHRMADAWSEKELARALVVRAAREFDAAAPNERVRIIAAMKHQVGEAGRLVGQECVQMHGALGVSAEAPISHYYRRLIAIDTLYGNASVQIERFLKAS